MVDPNNPVLFDVRDPLKSGPYLVKVDRYGSVSGLVQVKVPLGVLVIVPNTPLFEAPYGS